MLADCENKKNPSDNFVIDWKKQRTKSNIVDWMPHTGWLQENSSKQLKWWLPVHLLDEQYHSGPLVPAVLTATSHFYGNSQNSTPRKIQTPQPITIKLCTVDYVHETNS